MGIAVRNEGSNVNSNINVTPMVDVMLVLLIIFMVITPMLQNKVAVDMAKVENPTPMPDADKEDAIVVAITRDGGVFLGQNKVATSEQLGLRSEKSWPTRRAKRSLFAPMRARSSAPLKMRLTPSALQASMKWACSPTRRKAPAAGRPVIIGLERLYI